MTPETDSRARSFPTPFKCSGDFCGFALQLSQADPLSAHRNGGRRAAAAPPLATATSALSLLLSKEELRALGDANVSRLVAAMEVAQSVSKGIDGKSSDGELRVLTYKSVALGKGNRQQLQKSLQSQQPTSPDKASSPNKASRESHLLDSTLSQELRESSRSRVYGELDGVANYYRQVRVCSDCYAVYSLLDLARQMSAGGPEVEASVVVQQKQRQLKRKQLQVRRQRAAIEDKWEERVEQQVREKEAILLRKHRGASKQTLAAVVEDSTNSTGENQASFLPTLSSSARSNPNILNEERETPSCMDTADKHTASMPLLHSPESNTTVATKSSKALPSKKSQLQQGQSLLRSNETLVGMDSYLRGASRHIEAPLMESSCEGTTQLMHRDGDSAIQAATKALAKAKREQQLRQFQRRRRLEASNSLAMPGLAEMDARDDYVHGVFQMDAETAVPFCVMGGASMVTMGKSTDPTDSDDAFFNLVVVHDLFDSWERLQILLQPLVARYRGRVQVLLWNYPGQAYTTWRRGATLDNSFHVECLSALLGHVTGASGGDRHLRDKPYHLVGIGNGGNISLSFCCSSEPRDANTRSLVLLNGFAHVDAQLAEFLHDTAKVLSCTPESRPDLPVYFHARFLFSATYLARVSTPLALNLYTAVLNPITLEGRQALTLGALAHRDVRPDLKYLRVPLISICSTQNTLVDAGAHAETILGLANLVMANSIGKALRYRRTKSVQQRSAGRGKRPTCVIWVPGGHEALQECKQDVLLLLEQLVTGFHEVNDVPHGTSRKQSEQQPEQLKSRYEDEQPQQESRNNKKDAKPQRNFEDAFIDRVLTTAKSVVPTAVDDQPLDGTQWHLHQQQLVERTSVEPSGAGAKKVAPPTHQQSNSNQQQVGSKASKIIALTSWDPNTPAFERISANVVYQPGAGSKIYPLLPEVKEYMGWRVRRNQKRLQRMASMARVIQRAFRAFYARTLTHRMHRERCAIHLQRLWRARAARKRYKGLKREDWAVRLLQRHWRGKMGRSSYKQRMLEYLAALDIQRVARGRLARHRVVHRRRQIYESAVRIQQLVRRYVARSKMFRQRQHRNAAVHIQRVFRGLLGRRRFDRERDRFLFSKTQSQGLTFGKQMLLEYKLFGTKLQSEVALLAQEKTDVENQAEKLVKEICEFDEGIRLLEAELLALSQAESDNSGANRTLDETAKWALREQKMRLDREFSQMLAQIAQRREKLATLEETLARVDQERLKKEEELKSLERKLVVLLDEQQKELTRIREKQETRSQLALDFLPSAGSASAMSPASRSAFGSSPVTTTSSPSLGPGSGLPSHSSGARAGLPAQQAQGFTKQQREEAASLMESTETMMKFGFMSMSMTYFSSMNMVRAMRKIGAHHLTLDSAAAVSQQRWPENTASDTPSKAMTSFQASIPPGGFPGQQPLQVAAWSVSDVGRWLDTLALAQYKRAFADATVDGALLLHLTDDDLRHTLGMEHRLHRKKVLTTLEEMRVREREQVRRLYGENTGSPGPVMSDPVVVPNSSPAKPFGGVAAISAAPAPIASSAPAPQNPSEPPAGNGRVVVPFVEFCSLVRHGKLKQIREALQDLPERKFDPLTAVTQFAPGTGTIYNDTLEKSVFHINKGDDKGNSPLLMAAQNNHLKVAQLLVAKGANPDHQNSRGHTAGHYAMAYSFFDLGAWLLDPDKGGGRDDLLNENGLNAYDGLE